MQFSTIVILASLLLMTEAIIIDSEAITSTKCIGSLKLHHHETSKLIHIDAGTLRDKGRGKRSIKSKGMKYAEVAGPCCWEVRKRKYGGEFQHLKTVKTHTLPWDITFVSLIKCAASV